MTNILRPDVECDRLHATIRAPVLAEAIAHYTSVLGFELGFTWGEPASFAGLNLGSMQIFLEQGTADPRGCSVQFVVGSADELHAYHVATGADIVEPIADREYGLRDYAVRDLNGYRLSFGHYIYNAGPPLEIERVDVPLRLEKRLAGLLYDLAEYKHMSLSSCVEEIILHTNEPLGDGVANPHTQTQLHYIQKLKQKHGIDYDSHASYRFVERVRE